MARTSALTSRWSPITVTSIPTVCTSISVTVMFSPATPGAANRRGSDRVTLNMAEGLAAKSASANGPCSAGKGACGREADPGVQPCPEVLPRQGGAGRRDAGLPARREDRRGRAERDGQVHAAADDGRDGAALQRRGASHARLQRGHLGAGAGTGRARDGARQRGRRRRGDQGPGGTVRPDRGEDGRGLLR